MNILRHCATLRRLLAVALLLLSFATGAAQDPARLEHRRWLSSDGAPGQVGAIADAADGYLWLGSNDSLVRFDGLRFRRQSPAARGAPVIVSALLARGDGLWVGLRSGGVARARPGQALAREQAAGAPAGVVFGLAQDRGGALWAAAEDGLARRSNGAWRRVGADQGFGAQGARAVLVDRDGAVWAAGGGGCSTCATGPAASSTPAWRCRTPARSHKRPTARSG